MADCEYRRRSGGATSSVGSRSQPTTRKLGRIRLPDQALSASAPPAARHQLRERIASGTAVVGIYGLGYVGLPLALAIAARSSYRIIGFDIDPAKIESLNAGRSYFRHLPSALVGKMVASGRFTATTDVARTGDVDVVLLCLPTPLNRNREPDLSFVTGTVRSIFDYLRPGQLLILESTTYPGTTRDLLAPLYRERGLALEEDIFLAYSPEREDPGNAQFETSTIPKVVGGDGRRGARSCGPILQCVRRPRSCRSRQRRAPRRSSSPRTSSGPSISRSSTSSRSSTRRWASTSGR